MSSKSSFPRLSQVWRAVRLAGFTFGAAALSGLSHLPWPSKTSIVAAGVAAAEVAWRAEMPSGKLSGWVANLVAAYRQVTAAAHAASKTPADPAPAAHDAPAPAAAPVIVAPADGAPTEPIIPTV